VRTDADPADAEVVDVRDARRYELRLGDRAIGRLAYETRGDTLILTHTEVDHAWEGRGFGSRLVAGVLEDVTRRGLRVVPVCWFVAAYIRRHPEHQALLAA
jgi:predicted GNAT family acetyltransferase